ncbi:MAG: HAD family hydrolase [Actinomycetota bacterium]|jgi:putative hydrolase of the HAD superfamily|nr:HAD family hydrolase [Actinomycetota bacterium]
MLRAVIFDLDDTLIADQATARASVRTAAALLPDVEPERVVEVVLATADAAWYSGPYADLALELGISPREGLWSHFVGCHPRLDGLAAWAPTYRADTWRTALVTLGVEDGVQATAMADAYEAAQRAGHPLLDGADDVVRRAAAHYRVGLLTNGPGDIQRIKAEGTGLTPLFSAFVVSGEVGVGKPSPEVFELVLGALDVGPDEAVMVGDNWDRDVRGALASGMAAVWIAGGRPVPDPDPGVPAATSIAEVTGLLEHRGASEPTPSG